MLSHRTTRAILTLLVSAVCLFCRSTATLGQSDQSDVGKLGPVLGAMKKSALPEEDLIPVIIQFAQGPPDRLKQENRVIERANVGHSNIFGTTSLTWCGFFVDPTSMSNSEDILSHGETGEPPNLITGPAGSWFYPPQ